MDKAKMDIDLMPKDVSNGNQNAGIRTEEETDKQETKKVLVYKTHIEVLISCRSYTPTLHCGWRGLWPSIHVGRL
jgi:hypothetical protein